MANELVSRLTHQQLIGTNKPGLFLILLDQSLSMEDPVSPGWSKAQEAAFSINKVIAAILAASDSGEEIKDRCTLGVIGYGQQVAPIIGGKIPEFDANNIGTDERDGIKYKVWVEPKHSNGTPMAAAFKIAYDIAKEWTEDTKNQDSFPPIVINITDGVPNDFTDTGSAPETEKVANSIGRLGTNDGNLLVLNVHIGQASAPEIVFPANKDELPNLEAKLLFEISSEVPEKLREDAEKKGLKVRKGSRGMVYNATPSTLIQLLNFGTQTATEKR